MASKPTTLSSAASTIFRPGSLVEISNDVDGYRGSWFTGKIVRCLRGDKFVVEYDRIMEDEEGTMGLQETAMLSQLRPIPPKDIIHDFKIGDEVDAYHNDGWWEGRISRSLGGGMWAVYFKDWPEQLTYPEEELRRHHKWVNGSWIPPFSQQHLVVEEDSETELDLEEECAELKRYFNTLDIVGQRIMKKKVRELTHSTTTFMCPSLMKYTPNREIKKRKKDQESYVHRDSSQWEHVEGSQGSQTTKRSCIKSTKSHMSSQSLRHLYLSHFPIFLHQYIDDIVNVQKDGNCGFRAIAALLGWGEKSWPLVRKQLDDEIYQHHQMYSNVFYDTISKVRSSLQVAILGAQGREKWMTIPDMGYPIASRYNVILVLLSKNLNITFFPLVISPRTVASKHKIIAVGFVNNNHWVQVKLKSSCPLPPTTDRWRQNCSEGARAWETTYAGRIRHWEEEVRKST